MNKFDQHLEGLWANINKARKKGTTSSKWKNDPEYRSKLKKAVKKLEEDGHNDVESVNKQIHVAIKALKTIKDQVNTLSDDADLPTWWTNKVAIAIDKLDGMADYLDATVPESVDNINEKKADRCKRRADSVYGKKTSAYKSGAIVRCRQGKIWKKK